MKKILAPTDFSATSQNAVMYAARLADSLKIELSLVHVCTLPVASHEIAALAYNIKELLDAAEAQMALLKEKVRESLPGNTRINTVILQGDVITEIKNYCASEQPMLIVMGAETKNSFERFLIGGRTIAAIKQLLWPVLVVPRNTSFKSIKKMGLACDYKDLAETIPVEEIKNIVKQFQAELYVLHIGPDRWDDFDVAMMTEASWLRRELEEIKPIYDFVRDNNVEEGLNRFAADKRLDLLIIVPKKHSLLSRMFQYSHSRQLILHTNVLVMSIHNNKKEIQDLYN